MDGKLGLRPHGIDHKAVSCIDGLFVSEIDDYYLAVYLCYPVKLGLEELLLLEIEVYSFLYIGKLENIINVVVNTVCDEFHHKVIVGDPEIVESSQTCSCIHKEIHEDPAGRIEYLVDSKVSGVALINSFQDLLGNCLEPVFAAVEFIYDSRCGLGTCDANELLAEFILVSP